MRQNSYRIRLLNNCDVATKYSSGLKLHSRTKLVSILTPLKLVQCSEIIKYIVAYRRMMTMMTALTTISLSPYYENLVISGVVISGVLYRPIQQSS